MVLSPPRQEASLKTGGNGELSDFFEAAHVVNDEPPGDGRRKGLPVWGVGCLAYGPSERCLKG